MPEYDNNMTGVLFPEHDKKSDRHPDFTGKVEIDGTEYRLAGWKRRTKNGDQPFLSLKVSEFEVPTPEEIDPDGALDFS